MLNKGECIPDLTLESQDGTMVSLTDYIGKKPLVVYFYPRNNTRICNQQACSFRDNYEDFKAFGAEVIGISKDSTESHKNVSRKRNLPFILLSDPNKIAFKAFKVPSALLGLLPGRVTFVIDKNGKIAHSFRGDFNADKHINEALRVLKS